MSHQIWYSGPGNEAACICGKTFSAQNRPKAIAAAIRHINHFDQKDIKE